MQVVSPILLAGGSGTRLWPLSRKSYPKQFNKIISDKSLFQSCAKRLTSSDIVEFDPHITLTNQGEYIVGLFAAIFLEKEPGATIVHDPRVIWNTQSIVKSKGGVAVQSKTGHAFIKQTMRTHEAIYGGEISAHHYFRDFAFCDSGMIPWLLIAELISKSGRSLADWVKDRLVAFPSSGETNFRVTDANDSISRVLAKYRANAVSLDDSDGLSLTFKDWRLNLRSSNTEPLVRLNIECHGNASMLKARVADIANIICGTKV